MSTLADLQRRNLAKMESSELQETKLQQTKALSAADVSLVGNPSNEVSIIPSLPASFTLSDDATLEGTHDDAIIASPAQGVKPLRARVSKASHTTPKPEASKSQAPKASTGAKAGDAARLPLKDALDAQLRAHLMEQLMPAAGKEPVTRLNVEMPEDLHQRLKQHCVKTRTPIKALINALIALYLQDEAEA